MKIADSDQEDIIDALFSVLVANIDNLRTRKILNSIVNSKKHRINTLILPKLSWSVYAEHSLCFFQRIPLVK